MAVLAVASAVVGVAAFLSYLRVPVSDDEAWFLQVVQRCRHGDVLYRDVFYGAGPLPVWLARLAIRCTRPQMIVLRALKVAYFVGLLLAGTWVLDTIGADVWTKVAFWVGSVAFASPSWGAENHYGQLTWLSTAVAAGAIAEWATGGTVWWVVLAGAALGCGIASKQSLGIVAAVTLGFVVLVEGSGEAAAVFGAAMVATVTANLVPVLRQRAFPAYVARAFVNKTTYLETGRLRVREWMDDVLRARALQPPFAAFGVVVALSSLLILGLLAAAAVVSTLALAVEGVDRPGALAPALGLALALVALSGAFPRTDLPHVQGLFPLGLLSVLLTLHAGNVTLTWWPADAVSWCAGALGAWAVAGVVVSLDTVHRIPLPEDGFDRRVPHFRVLPVRRHVPGVAPSDTHTLRAMTGGRAFLLRPDAAFWYLAGGLVNPTPYDYPYASVFGPRGQAETIDRIRSGEIAWVCSPGPISGRLAPAELQQFVVDCMEPVAVCSAGTVYRLLQTSNDEGATADVALGWRSEPTTLAAPGTGEAAASCRPPTGTVSIDTRAPTGPVEEGEPGAERPHQLQH